MEPKLLMTQEKYEELYNTGVIDRVCPEPGYGDTINSTLYNLLDNNNIQLFDFGEIGSHGEDIEIYDHIREYSINLNKFVDRYKRKKKLLKINFTSSHTTIDRLRENMQKYKVDNRFFMFIVNPRLYTYSYTPENPHFGAGYLSLAHVGIYNRDPTGVLTFADIIRLDNYMLEKTGENLFYTL